MIKRPEDILKKWLGAVNSGDVENLLDLYDSQAVLIPTFSNRLLNTRDDLRKYFEKLGAKKELSIELHEKTLITQNLQNEISLISGIYNWRFAVDEELLNFEARFSYTLDLSKPNPILHHHSSQIPRTL